MIVRVSSETRSKPRKSSAKIVREDFGAGNLHLRVSLSGVINSTTIGVIVILF
jgi:hypothetical protein